MRYTRMLSLLGAVTVSAGLVLTGVPSAAIPSAPAKWDGHLNFKWQQIRDHKRESGPLATAPHASVATVVLRNDLKGFHLHRMSRDASDLWGSKWVVDEGPLSRLIPEAVAVNKRHRAIIVAGHGVCRSQEARRENRGPIFLRSYTLSGQHRWTQWIGQCPSRGSDHTPRALTVTGADSWGDHLVISFTQGTSFDSGVQRRRGHVVSYRLGGAIRWRTTLRFAHDVDEAIAHDVTVSRGLVAASGELIRGTTRDSFVVGLSQATGSLKWRDVIHGRIVDYTECHQSLDSTDGDLYAAGIGPDARGILERRDPSGDVRWRARVPRCVEVSALNGGGALWSGIGWSRTQPPLIFGLQRPGGKAGWRQQWALPDGRFPVGPAFAATDRFTVAGAELINRKGNGAAHLWYWRWR